MSHKITVISDGLVLRPSDAWAQEEIAGLPRGVEFTATITQARSLPRIGLYWAGLALAVENFDEPYSTRFPTSRFLHNALMIDLGYKTITWRIDGSFQIDADSIAFDRMTEADFAHYMDKAQVRFEQIWSWNPWETYLAEKKAANPNYRSKR